MAAVHFIDEETDPEKLSDLFKVTAKLRFEPGLSHARASLPLPLMLTITAYTPNELGPTGQGGGQTVLG